MNVIKKILLIIVVLVVGITLFFIASVIKVNYFSPAPDHGPVIGDLGGAPVDIPRAYARFVEYNQDPNFLEGEGEDKKRSYQSKLRSLGFEVRYPDMASADKKTEEEKNIRTTKWMRVGVKTGEFYGAEGDRMLENKKIRYIDRKQPCSKNDCIVYQPLPEKTYGLTGYAPTGSGIDVEKRSINFGRGTSMKDKNVYFIRDKNGAVTNFIECNNRTHAAVRCVQYFNLSPKIKAWVTVDHRKDLLPHWKEIQQLVTALIYSFEVQSTTDLTEEIK